MAKWRKKLRPSVKPFKAISSLNEKIGANLVPKKARDPFLKHTRVAINSNVIKTSADLLRMQVGGGDVGQNRAALRRYHFNTFLPYDKRTQDLRDSKVMLASNDPATRIRGQELQDRTDASTMKHGRAGIAVAGVVVGGGVAGAAVKAAAGATRPNPGPGEHGSVFNQAETLPYGYENIPPDSMRGKFKAPPRASSRIIDALFRLLVPKPTAKAKPIPYENYAPPRLPVSSVFDPGKSSPDGARRPYGGTYGEVTGPDGITLAWGVPDYRLALPDETGRPLPEQEDPNRRYIR